MSTGRGNKLVGQTGEYLVCAELGRQGLIATPFAGNVPNFDVLAADDQCRTLPLQVKTTAGISWPSRADAWMQITYDAETQTQIMGGPIEIDNPDLIYVFVALVSKSSPRDRFFVLTKKDLQTAIIKSYSTWMDGRGWQRPRKPESLRSDFWIPAIEKYEGNWELIRNNLSARPAAYEQA